MPPGGFFPGNRRFHRAAHFAADAAYHQLRRILIAQKVDIPSDGRNEKDAYAGFGRSPPRDWPCVESIVKRL